MDKFDLLNNYIKSISSEFDINDNKEKFILLLNCFLIAKIRTTEDNGDNILKKVYPYLLDEKFNYDSTKVLNIINFFSKNSDDDILGYLYENSLTSEERKDYGQFYTRSKDVVSYMVDLLKLDDNLKILEPSAGSGLFLIEIITRKLKKCNSDNVEDILLDIYENIYINDVDSFACKITEANILVSTIEYIKIAFQNNNDFTLPRLSITNIDFCEYKEKNTFDVVISNPPYVTMYGKRSRNMTEEKRNYFNTFDFVINKKGNNKFNMIMFFIENGIKALRENGKLIFIVDISFFETAFIDIRKYILENCYIESITTNMSEFENVASGQMIISLIKIKTNKLTKWYDYKEKTVKEIEQSIWKNEQNNYKIYIPFSSFSKKIDEKVKRFNSLDSYFPGKALRTCCALTGKTEEFLVDENKVTENIVFPFLEGSKGV